MLLSRWIVLLSALGLLTVAACGNDQKRFSVPIAESSGQSRGCMLPGWIACGETCVNPLFDPGHCGACDSACAGGEVCVSGACQADCGELELCGRVCRYPDDPENCGNCGVSCDWGCARGKCSSRGDNSGEGCPGSLVGCGGLCVDVDSDPKNCGRCGTTCSSGLCEGGTCIPCSGTKKVCNGKCVDIMTSTSNCGACGRYCSGTCQNGVCCSGSSGKFCDGKCVDTWDDEMNCGGCGKECRSGYSCSTGTCRCSSYGCY